MMQLLLVVAAVFCAYRVMRARRLLMSTIWLAATSALVAILLYLLGAPDVAVIELSVGAGLVTVLFVFAFSIVGEDTLDELTTVPHPLVWALILLAACFLGWFTFPLATGSGAGEQLPFARVLWEQRGLDVLAQIVLIFAGTMGLLGLLAEQAAPATQPAALVPAAEARDGSAGPPPAQAEPQPEAPVLEEASI